MASSLLFSLHLLLSPLLVDWLPLLLCAHGRAQLPGSGIWWLSVQGPAEAAGQLWFPYSWKRESGYLIMSQRTIPGLFIYSFKKSLLNARNSFRHPGIHPALGDCVCVCVLRNRGREREVVRTCFRGTSLHIAVFREREVWFGIQIDLDSDPPVTSSVKPWVCCLPLSSPIFSSVKWVSSFLEWLWGF